MGQCFRIWSLTLSCSSISSAYPNTTPWICMNGFGQARIGIWPCLVFEGCLWCQHDSCSKSLAVPKFALHRICISVSLTASCSSHLRFCQRGSSLQLWLGTRNRLRAFLQQALALWLWLGTGDLICSWCRVYHTWAITCHLHRLSCIAVGCRLHIPSSRWLACRLEWAS